MDIFLIDALKTRLLFHPSINPHIKILERYFFFSFSIYKKETLLYELKHLAPDNRSVPTLWQIFSKVFLISPALHLTKTMFPTLKLPYFASTSDFARKNRDRNNERWKISRDDMSKSGWKLVEKRTWYERKINDSASTLIIPIHKVRYPDTSATSGLIKNDDREGRKLQAAYRPINSTSARPATLSSPRSLRSWPALPSASISSRFQAPPLQKNPCNYR